MSDCDLLFDEWDYIGPRHVFMAICKLHDEMTANNEKPGSAHWECDTRKHRPELIERIINKWAESAERNPWDFPFSDDFIVATWIRYRKAGEQRRSEWRACLGL